MRDHGTRACYVFGPQPGGDRSNGCRCDPCRAANRAYQRNRDRARRRPDVTVEPAYIDAGEVRRHLRWLSRHGVGLRTVAARSGVPRSALAELKTGRRRRCTPDTADRVLLVLPVDAADQALVDARPTWRLIDDLITHGHTRTSIARALGSTAATPALQIGRHQVTARTARKVKALHAALLADVLVDREHERRRRAAHRGRAA